MTKNFLKIALLSATIGVALTGVARADCESDLIQLEQAFKTPNLTTVAKSALDDAKTKAVSALKKDDDKTCHNAIAEGMTMAGLKLK
jgi:hypothetical protein